MTLNLPAGLAAPVRPRSATAEAAARERLDSLVKPLGALGRLEDLAAWLAGAQDRCPPTPLDRRSGDISREDALTPDEAVHACEAGAAIADEHIDAGTDLLIPGDMGIGNTTVAAALVAADAAATVGLLLRAATRGVPVLLDGVFSGACALVAARAVPTAADWWLAGHRSTEPSHTLALDALGLRPILDLGMRLGEGSGAVTAVPVLRTAQALIAGMGTLADLDTG